MGRMHGVREQNGFVVAQGIQELFMARGKRGKTRGGMILRFSGRRESDSFWECRLLLILMGFRTPI
jgi:hypothetical protein